MQMKDYKPFIIFLLLIFILWLSSFIILPYIIPIEESRGLFGDSFGALNTLFSGMAFAGIIATIILQRNELQLQREELKLTRKELTKSAAAQDASQKALNLQVKLMTKQAVLSAYQTSYSGNLELLASRISVQGDPQARQKAMDELTELKGKINKIIIELEEHDSR